jgi:hypothetical protein
MTCSVILTSETCAAKGEKTILKDLTGYVKAGVCRVTALVI